MPLVLEPRIESGDLSGQLERARTRLQRTTLVQGAVELFAVALLAIAAACWIDQLFHIPSIGRALLLATIGGGLVWLGWKRLWTPIGAIGDHVYLALQIEKRSPEFGDALASAMQFQRDESEGRLFHDSTALRRATKRLAVRRTLDLDLHDLTKKPGIVRALLGLFIAFVVATPLILKPSAGLLLKRLTSPFSQIAWPPQTQLEVSAPKNIVRGEPFNLDVTLVGTIPDRVVLHFGLASAAPTTQSYALTPQSEGGREQLVIKLEPSRVPRPFQFMVTANDASTDWQTVDVQVPPELTAIDGRASPQMRFEYPAYTDLPPANAPDGAGAIEAIAGTKITIRAAINRPVAAAWISCRVNQPTAIGSLVGNVLASHDSFGAFQSLPVIGSLWGATPLSLNSKGDVCEGVFQPWISGVHELSFRDEHGFVGRWPLDVRVLADPSPSVMLERPSVAADSLELAPTASFTLKGSVADKTFAIRRVNLDYRIGLDEPFRDVNLYDGDAIGTAVSRLLGPWPSARLRPTRLNVDQRMSLTQFQHPDGSPLRVGDILTIAIAAQDYDDVSPGKSLGRSHEIEIRIVSDERLESLAQNDLRELAAGLQDLLRRQLQASELAKGPEQERRATGQLRNSDVADLEKAESQQRQILERMGESGEGVRGLAEKLARSLAENPKASQAGRERSRQIVEGMSRLTTDVLDPVGPLLSAARKEPQTTAPENRSRGPLVDATRKQAEAERSLKELIDLAEAGAATGTLAAQAAALAAEQRQLANERDVLSRKLPAGTAPGNLIPSDQAALEQLRNRQGSLAEKANSLTQKIDAEADQAKDGAEPDGQVKALAAARQAAHGTDSKQPSVSLTEQMNRAAQTIAQNQLGEAQQRQNAAAQQLEKIRDALREPDKQDLDRLLKDRTRLEEDVDRLTKAQESLQDQADSASKSTDPARRKQLLERLARDQEKLAEKAREAAQELSRQRQPEAARDMDRAAQMMDRARKEMEEGRNAQDSQDQALDQLDQASERAHQARAEVEERLQREKAIKFTERLKGLTSRQAAMNSESERLFQAAQTANAWSRSTVKSLTDLARDEEGLAKEVEQISGDNLQSLKILKRMAEHASQGLIESAAAIDDARSNGLNMATWEADRAAIRKPQELALKRLRQLYDLIKPPEDKPESTRAPSGRTGSSSDATPRPGNGESIPATAQLQALRELQAELNDRTAEFAKKHPNSATWTDAERAELAAIRRIQVEMLEMLREVTPDAPPPAGDKK